MTSSKWISAWFRQYKKEKGLPNNDTPSSMLVLIWLAEKQANTVFPRIASTELFTNQKKINMQNFRFIQNKNIQITPNFNMVELFQCSLTGGFNFFQPACLVEGLEVVRDFFGAPIIVTSCIRPSDPDWSPHKFGYAVDFITSINWSTYQSLIDSHFKEGTNSKLVLSLLELGVNCMIVEGPCVHLEYREINLNFHEDGDYYIGKWINDGTEFGENICYF